MFSGLLRTNARFNKIIPIRHQSILSKPCALNKKSFNNYDTKIIKRYFILPTQSDSLKELHIKTDLIDDIYLYVFPVLSLLFGVYLMTQLYELYKLENKHIKEKEE